MCLWKSKKKNPLEWKVFVMTPGGSCMWVSEQHVSFCWLIQNPFLFLDTSNTSCSFSIHSDIIMCLMGLSITSTQAVCGEQWDTENRDSYLKENKMFRNYLERPHVRIHITTFVSAVTQQSSDSNICDFPFWWRSHQCFLIFSFEIF